MSLPTGIQSQSSSLSVVQIARKLAEQSGQSLAIGWIDLLPVDEHADRVHFEKLVRELLEKGRPLFGMAGEVFDDLRLPVVAVEVGEQR